MSALSVISAFVKRRLVQPVSNLLRQGMTPRSLSATVAVGSVIGVVPAIGITTILSTAVAARFRLNIAATVLVSYLVQPLQFLLAIPFIRLGITIFGLGELRLTLPEMQDMFRKDWVDAISKLWMANLAGIAAWAMLSVPLGAALYYILLPIFRRVLPKPKLVVVDAPAATAEV
ncbi:DUF2062 domain-containing protein [Pontibacter korlensis]|uniref:DUF2062 domain-containing protein n=1 Tax=Pontibacter korlensis TaxID=400092 RepID=A0A0E3ZH76_9BACT|nr:DUF2062 domain-containing protein [Pontibacter korlensis]AKD04649.1 hypothetical protein PKOR_18055 [Pontibacter korlensis]